MKTQLFFDLTVSATVRLARMRKVFAEHATKYPHCPEYAKPKTWRDVRGTNYKSVHAYCCELSQGFDNNSPIWYAHTGPQFRHEKTAEEWAGRWSFPGYYTDVDCSETARGIVARLTHGRFIAGYEWTSNGERVYYPEIFDDSEEACRAADSHAERFADLAREDSYKYDQAKKLELEIDDSLQRLRECIALRHRQCMVYVRDEISELIETIREKRETLATEYADYV